ncbi:MAG TPA: GrpB family protein [Vicinamibacterales bacterium]
MTLGTACPERDAGMKTIVVVEYDSNWPTIFEQLRMRIWPAVPDCASSIEHVGSTSVPGLAAKPIIDVTVVVPTGADVAGGISRLAALGYVHQGNLGVEGREAFRAPGSTPRHHLYLCPSDSLALRNHLVVREYLRTHPEVAKQYGDLKRRLAEQFPADIDGYVAGKTDLIIRMLAAAGFRSDELESIQRINRRSV